MSIWGSSRFCVISLTYIGLIDLCVLCVFVVPSTPSLGEMYLRIHFTHQSWESLFGGSITFSRFILKLEPNRRTRLVVGRCREIGLRSRVASAFGNADIEVKAATLEAMRAELERIRIRKSSLQASRFVVTTSVVPDYNRFFKTGFGLIDISKK